MTRLTSLVFAMSLTTIGWAAEVIDFQDDFQPVSKRLDDAESERAKLVR